jgi:hypothetical protein
VSKNANRQAWQTYTADSANGWTSLQTALIDAIKAISCVTDGPPDVSSTRELADAVGCDVAMAWHALLSADYATPHWPAEPPSPGVWPDDAAVADRPAIQWSVPECWTEDDDEVEMLEALVEISRELGHAAAVAHWSAELAEVPHG